VLYLRQIILLVGDDVPIDSESFLVTDFVNLKIKSAQCFEGAYRGRMCVRIFIETSNHTYMNIYVYIVFLNKESMYQKNLCMNILLKAAGLLRY
jgi:hypothetical protein